MQAILHRGANYGVILLSSILSTTHFMTSLTYLAGYPVQLIEQVEHLLVSRKLSAVLLKKYPHPHDYRSDEALYRFTLALKKANLRQSPPISKIIYDDKIDVIYHALGLHTQISRVQGNKLKAKNEIRIGSVFKQAPIEFLTMIVVHELAHLREKQHNKAFYNLCEHMEPAYHQYELDLRVYLTHLEHIGPLYSSQRHSQQLES